jgi:hypothetical protein
MHSTFLSFLVVLVSALPLVQQAKPATPTGFRSVTSTHASYEYALPADWAKEGFNSYRGPDGSLIEQIYPPAQITPEYCASGGPRPYDESRVYDNGGVRGCYIMRRNGNFRRVSFRFPSPKGVEDISISMPEDKYDEARVKKIIDSVRLK